MARMMICTIMKMVPLHTFTENCLSSSRFSLSLFHQSSDEIIPLLYYSPGLFDI